MKNRILGVIVAAMCMNVAATEWFVDRTRPDDSGNGKSVEAAKRTIQAAVSAASAGDVVTVLPGVYDEGGDTFTANSVESSNRVHITKNLTLRSRDGAAVTHIVGTKDLTVAQDASPWGMGPAAVRCIAVATDVTDVKIEGFTIRDGATAFGGDTVPVRGAGILNMRNNPGAEFVSYIVASNCVFRDNTGTRGGATYGIRAVNCTFTGNRASNFGAAARQCHLEGCVLYRNSTLANNTVGVIAYGYSVVNCTIAYNETLSAFSNFDGLSVRFASNCVSVANSGCGIDQNIYTCITGITGKPNGCVYVDENAARIFVAPAAGDFRLRAEGEAVTQNPLADGYCGAVQEVVSCEGSGYLSFSKASAGTMYVDGVPVRSSVYAYAAPWPRAYAVTFEPDAGGKEIVYYLYNDLCRWPTADDVYYVLPPVSGGATVAAATGVVRYVSPSGDDDADGSAATPWRTLQGAMDGLVRDSIGSAVVYAAPGRYDEGGAVERGTSNRVVFASNRSVRLRAQSGPHDTFIVGAEDPAPAVANDYGLGPNATRCVAFLNSRHAVQGFTLTGGRTAVSETNSDIVGGRGGAAAAIAATGNGTYNSALLDCVVTNCVASRAGAMFGGTIDRCLLVDNVAVRGGNAITRTGVVRSSIYTRNRSGNGIVGQNSSARNCTVVSNYCSNVQLATNCDGASNTVFAVNAVGNDIESASQVGCCVYEKASVTPNGSVKETTLFADYLNGDFRPYAGNAGTYLGDPRVFADGGCFADFNGKPFPIGPNGRITAGAVSDLVTSLRIVSPVPGGTDVEGIFTEFPVTVTATRADRQLLGFEVNGATQVVSGASVTVTADQVADFTSFIVKPIYNTDWWVDATNGDDANTGWDAAHAKKTLAGAMSHAWAGETVHALPGVYDAGTMVQDNPFLTATTKSNTDVVIPSRVVVQTNVTLVAEGTADETVIEGGVGTKDGEYGLGLDAVRCVYLNKGSKVRGFTLRGGRTDWTNEMDDNNYGGGALGRAADGNAVEDCVVTGCVSHRGGAGFNVTFRRCRIVGNRVTGNSPAGRQVALYGCYVADNLGRDGGIYSGVVQYHGDIVGCTFAADNGLGTMAGRTADCRLTVGQQPGYKFWNNVVAMPYNRSEAQVLSNAYHNVFSDAIRFDVLEGADNIVASLEEIALGPDGVPCHGSVAIGAGDFEHALTNLTGETGLNGVRRGLGGGVDAGAFEFDWLPQFAQDLGGRGIVVTAADNAVFENNDGLVEIPSGNLTVTWTPAAQSASCPCIFKVNVTGNGTLTVTKDGATLGTYTHGEQDVHFFGSGAMALEFAYTPGENDEGGAVLSGFSADIGTMLILR